MPEMTTGKVLYCLEVLHSVQTDLRTASWYRGEVRGKAAVGEATAALWRRDLIAPKTGSPPFRLTSKGEAFLKTHKKAWAAFGVKTDWPKTMAHFTEALNGMPEMPDVGEV